MHKNLILPIKKIRVCYCVYSVEHIKAKALDNNMKNSLFLTKAT